MKISRSRLIAVTLLAGTIGAASCRAEQQPLTAAGAGRWYPADKAELAAMVDGFLAEKPDTPITGRPAGIIVPHAGYQYSGKCAGAAFSAIKGLEYARVIVIGLSHAGMPGAAVLNAESYVTPLGAIEIDRDACTRLLAEKPFAKMPRAFVAEHSLDNQVPFIQRALKGKFRLVPMLVGAVTPEQVASIAKQIKPLLGQDALLVASSDFTHYGRDAYGYAPFAEDVPANLEKLAKQAAEPILKLDAGGFAGHVERTGDTICGRSPIGVLLQALPKDAAGTVARFYTSGSLTGDYAMSVSYQSFIFTRKETDDSQKETANMLSKEAQVELLKIARQALEAAVSGKKKPPLKTDFAELQKEQGAFVTLMKDGDLRGCIGQFTADEPLYKVVVNRAWSAALEDPRFSNFRLKPADLPTVKIEVSVLSPMVRVKDPAKEVKLGVHGIYIKRGWSTGTFLPQVATDHKMTLEEFLSTCCSQKAGLSPDAWKDPATEVYVYTAQVFGEGE